MFEFGDIVVMAEIDYAGPWMVLGVTPEDFQFEDEIGGAQHFRKCISWHGDEPHVVLVNLGTTCAADGLGYISGMVSSGLRKWEA